MQENYTGLHRSLREHRTQIKRRSREKAGEAVFQLFLLAAFCWHAFGGLTLFQDSANLSGLYNGSFYVGVGAITYSVGWWLRYSLTGWRGLL